MFEGIKVVELASVLAGPAVGMFFAELGAEVIKIENAKTDGDVTRKWKLPTESATAKASAYFSSVNYGKEHRFVDLTEPAALKAVQDLIASADIVIANFKQGDDVKFGLDYTTLSATNTRLIYAWLKGFESQEERVAFDVVLQAEAGYMFMNGQADGPSTKMPLAMMDLLAAHQLKAGVLTALYQRERTGKGAFVESSLERAALASLANQATNWLMAEHIPQRMGSLHPNIAPYGEVFTCKDGKELVMAVGSNRQFSGLLEVLELSPLAEDERYNSNVNRIHHRSALFEELQHAISNHARDELLDALISNQVPAGAIRNMREVFETPVAKSMILEEDQNGELTRRVSSVGFQVRSFKEESKSG